MVIEGWLACFALAKNNGLIPSRQIKFGEGLGKFRKLLRFNDYRTSYRIAYGHDPGPGTEDYIGKAIESGALILPPIDESDKPKYCKGRGLFTEGYDE